MLPCEHMEEIINYYPKLVTQWLPYFYSLVIHTKETIIIFTQKFIRQMYETLKLIMATTLQLYSLRSM